MGDERAQDVFCGNDLQIIAYRGHQQVLGRLLRKAHLSMRSARTTAIHCRRRLIRASFKRLVYSLTGNTLRTGCRNKTLGCLFLLVRSSKRNANTTAVYSQRLLQYAKH